MAAYIGRMNSTENGILGLFPHFHRHYGKKMKNFYSETINLPKTTFKLRLDPSERKEKENEIRTKCKFDELYEWQRRQNREKEFVLHDGPPYANGHPHMGHAVNKVAYFRATRNGPHPRIPPYREMILKDMTNRYKLLRGFKVHYIPGWDCHGLPIELKALQDDKFNEDERPSPLAVRQKARKVAEKYSRVQMDAFKRWAVMAHWPQSYFTYNPSYVSTQLELFFNLYNKNLIYREFKPVHWSPGSRTALAEAELEYDDNHTSPSLYLKVEVTDGSSAPPTTRRTHALIWTTTPWTLPANRAICYAPDQMYCVAECQRTGDALLIAVQAKAQLEQTLSTTLSIISEFEATALGEMTYRHPLLDTRLPFLPSKHVTLSKGTGLVHCAPLHGPEDYLVALEHKIPLGTCQVDEDGRFTGAYGPRLEGKEVLTEGTDEVLALLSDKISFKGTYAHSYPYDWRTKSPVIFRASLQWFIDTEKLRDRAIELLEEVKFSGGEAAKRVMVQQLSKRPYWCVSRQRNWGVPIPVFYDQSDEPIINRDTVDHLRQLVLDHGPDFWWKLDPEELLPAQLRHRSAVLRRGRDIMDIWFDSGSSWANALQGTVADLCVEGEDQLGAWFQSSLLLSVAARDEAPYRALRVHGFTLDSQGRKMSKSLGNVVDPMVIVDGGGTKETPAYGADVLRLWVAQHASGNGNAHFKPDVIEQTAEDYHKIRSTIRYLLALLSDYKATDPPLDSLHLLDRYLLHLLYHYNSQVTRCYDDLQFNRAINLALNFLTREISSFYCHVVKDRLYCQHPSSVERLSCQVAVDHALRVLIGSLGPALPYLAEEVFAHLPRCGCESFFHGLWTQCPDTWDNPVLEETFNLLSNLRRVINRTATSMSAGPQEFRVTVTASGSFYRNLREMQAEDTSRYSQLCEFTQVSEMTVIEGLQGPPGSQEVPGVPDCYVEMRTSGHHLCPRCRRFTADVANEPCPRCVRVIGECYA